MNHPFIVVSSLIVNLSLIIVQYRIGIVIKLYKMG